MKCTTFVDHTIYEDFRRPQFEALSEALQRVIKYTKAPRYLRMLEGCVNMLKKNHLIYVMAKDKIDLMAKAFLS